MTVRYNGLELIQEKTTPTIELSKGDKDYLFRQVVNRDNDITLQEVINWPIS